VVDEEIQQDTVVDTQLKQSDSEFNLLRANELLECNATLKQTMDSLTQRSSEGL